MTLRPLPKPAHTFYPKRGKFETFSANQMLAYAEQAVAAQVDRLRDENKRLWADAERYRWLRNEGNPYALLVVGKHHATDVRPYYDVDLDDAIDAARAALKETP